MIVVCEPLLDCFRASPICEHCQKTMYGPCEPHHIFARGMGGGSRLDIPCNIIALCNICHGDYHAGTGSTAEYFWRVVARRYGIGGGFYAIMQEARRCLNVPKGGAYECVFTGFKVSADANNLLGRDVAALRRRILPHGRRQGVAPHEDGGGWTDIG